MVCKDCEKKSNTVLATPQVKKKHEVQSSSHDMKKPTLGNTGVVKSKLLSRSGKNPYAAYASADCKATSCFKKVEAGKKYCATCGYSQQLCTICGKKLTSQSNSKTPIINGQKFTAK